MRSPVLSELIDSQQRTDREAIFFPEACAPLGRRDCGWYVHTLEV